MNLISLKNYLNVEKMEKSLGLVLKLVFITLVLYLMKVILEKFIFEQKEEYCKINKLKCTSLSTFNFKSTYKAIVNEWNKKFTEFSCLFF